MPSFATVLCRPVSYPNYFLRLDHPTREVEAAPIVRHLAFLCVLATLLEPPFTHVDEVDAYIALRMEKEHLPGLSIVVVKDGKVVKLKGYGYADLELKVPASPETVYQIGSITKQFTAAAILMLVRQGRVKLDDPIRTYLDGAPATWQHITVRHLLTHTSGLPSEAIPTTDKTQFADYTEEDMVKSAMAATPLSPPGAKYSYGNLEYDLLALIIERASGKSYADFLQERIFRPLGMTSTRVNDRQAIVPHRAQAYLWTGDGLRRCEPEVSPMRYLGSGSILSTVVDLAKWDAALYTDAILDGESRKVMWTPARLTDGTVTEYGFGWVISSVKQHADIHHNGAMNGFVGNISRFVDDRLTVIVLVNQSGLSNTERIATGVARIYIPAIRPAMQGQQTTRVKLDSSVSLAIAGRYEYWPNFMLTLRRGNGVLLGQLPVGEADDYVPMSATSFWQPEEGVQLTVERSSSGEVTGLRVRQDDGTVRTIPRIGPLFSALVAQPDSAPELIHKLEGALRAIVLGGNAVRDEPKIAAGAKNDFLSGTTDFAAFKSLSYVASQDVASRGIVRHGEHVSRVVYCDLVGDRQAEHILLYLTVDSLLADYDIVEN